MGKHHDHHDFSASPPGLGPDGRPDANDPEDPPLTSNQFTTTDSYPARRYGGDSVATLPNHEIVKAVPSPRAHKRATNCCLIWKPDIDGTLIARYVDAVRRKEEVSHHEESHHHHKHKHEDEGPKEPPAQFVLDPNILCVTECEKGFGKGPDFAEHVVTKSGGVDLDDMRLMHGYATYFRDVFVLGHATSVTLTEQDLSKSVQVIICNELGELQLLFPGESWWKLDSAPAVFAVGVVKTTETEFLDIRAMPPNLFVAKAAARGAVAKVGGWANGTTKTKLGLYGLPPELLYSVIPEGAGGNVVGGSSTGGAGPGGVTYKFNTIENSLVEGAAVPTGLTEWDAIGVGSSLGYNCRGDYAYAGCQRAGGQTQGPLFYHSPGDPDPEVSLAEAVHRSDVLAMGVGGAVAPQWDLAAKAEVHRMKTKMMTGGGGRRVLSNPDATMLGRGLGGAWGDGPRRCDEVPVTSRSVCHFPDRGRHLYYKDSSSSASAGGTSSSSSIYGDPVLRLPVEISTGEELDHVLRLPVEISTGEESSIAEMFLSGGDCSPTPPSDVDPLLIESGTVPVGCSSAS